MQSRGGDKENFVRRNLKKKHFSYKKNNRKRSTDGNNNRNSKYRRYSKGPMDISANNDDSIADVVIPSAKGSAGHGLDNMMLSLKAVAQTQKPTFSARAPEKLPSFLFNSFWSKSVDQNMLSLLEQLAPLCPGHSMPAKLLTVKKTGGNKGRRFYACCFPADQRCNFFLWAEDNPDLLSSLNFNHNPASMAIDFCTSLYDYKLSQLSKESLVREIMRFKVRREANALQSGKLKTSGSIVDLCSQLRQEAAYWIEQSHRFYGCLHLFGATPASSCATQTIISAKNKEEAHEEGDEMIYLSDSDDNEDCERGEEEVTKTEVHKPNDTNDSDHCSKSEGESGDEESGDENSADEDSLVVLDESDDDLEVAVACVAAKKSQSDSASSTDRTSIESLAQWFYGYKRIKPAQNLVMERVISGQSTLAVLPTGYGKSLCYILPSAVLSGVTIVISPLISLIRDQAFKLPCDMGYANFSGAMGSAQCKQLVDTVLGGTVKVIFVSPERFCSKSFVQFMSRLQCKYQAVQNASVVALLCVDEAHCITQWSHLFRASYLHIPHVVRMIKPRTVLALTATASLKVQKDICVGLGIDEETGVVEDLGVRENIDVQFREEDDEHERKELLYTSLVEDLDLPLNNKVKKIADKNSLRCNSIVYVHRRKDCDDMKEHLAVLHQLKNIQIYHAGMQVSDKEKVQKNYQHSQEFKCIIATIAFGMGVDKSDIHQVIHANLPRSLEGYLQEIGRAGRDAQSSARAIAFYNRHDAMAHAQLVYRGQVSFVQIARLLGMLLPPSCFDSLPAKSLAIVIGDASTKLDVSSALVETVCCMLQSQNVLTIDNFNEFESVQIKFKLHGQALSQLLQSNKNTVGSSEERVLYAVAREFVCSQKNNSKHNQNFMTNAYTTQKSFTMTRSVLCQLSGVPRDDLNYCLYKLQQQSFLEYTLSSSAVVYSLSANIRDAKTSYEQWLVKVARQITIELHDILAKSYTSAVSMFRLATTIEKCRKASDCSIVTSDVQKFIYYLLLSDNKQDSDETSQKLIAKLKMSEENWRVLMDTYTASPSPFPHKLPLQELRDAVRQLCKDCDILKLCKHVSVSDIPELANCTTGSAKKELLSQYIALVLAGLPTELMHAYPMRQQKYSGASHVGFSNNMGYYGDSDYDEPAPTVTPDEDNVKICVEFNPFLKACFGKYKFSMSFPDLYSSVLNIMNEMYS